MTNIFLTDSDEEALVEFVKDLCLWQDTQTIQEQNQEG